MFLSRSDILKRADPPDAVRFRQVEEVVCKVFSLKRQNDAAHQVEDWIAGGLSESKNKELDEKIEAVTNILKQVAGSMKTIPDVKVNKKTLSDMFKDGGKVPPEILEYVEMCFDQVIAFEEKRSFWDWNCFFVILIGVAQIVAGAALDVLTAGSAHYLAQGLISEGIGDITFAITSWVSGTFSWKARLGLACMVVRCTKVSHGCHFPAPAGLWTTQSAEFDDLPPDSRGWKSHGQRCPSSQNGGWLGHKDRHNESHLQRGHGQRHLGCGRCRGLHRYRGTQQGHHGRAR